MPKERKLDKRPVRTDLTSRECCRILAGSAGSLLAMADEEAVREAFRFIADRDDFWQEMRAAVSKG